MRRPSIGVVTFNAQQRAYIEALLRDADDDRLAAALDRADGEGLFVKNLENVQGDERDVVFFSTGFSVNASGALPLNFGPLNRTGGERRLNVAITRARRQVVVFSSFDPEQLRAEETSSVGIKHLRAYLDLAALGTDVLPRDARSSSVVDRHRESIAAALRARGLVVRTDVGLSEFRVDLSVSRPADPETPVMAVLLDGPAWARRGTVGDRDGLPVEVLGEMLRWPVVERVWLPSWLASADDVVDRLVAAVDAAPAAIAAPIPFPTAAIESFKGVAALRASVTSSVAVPATPAPRPAAKPAARKPSGSGGAGRRVAVRAVDPEDGRREVRARRAAGGEGRARGAPGADGGDQGRGAGARRPAGQADRGRVRAEPVERGAQGCAAVDAAAVGRGGRLPVARGRHAGVVDRVPAPGVEHRPGRSSTCRRRRSATRWRRCAGRARACGPTSC